jgi:hypothetical protein
LETELSRQHLGTTWILGALVLLIPHIASATDVVTSKHLFQKDQHLELTKRTCENGKPPIIIAFEADPQKINGPSIPLQEHFMPDKTRYFTAIVEKDTEGAVYQFCDFLVIKPYFDGLIKSSAESASK